MTTFRFLVRRCRAAVAGLGLAALAAGCDDAATTALVENGLSAPADAASSGSTAVYKLWWSTTLFPFPVGPNETSEPERTVPATDFAYALIAPGWLPGQSDRPPALVAIKSVAPLSASAHQLLRISVTDDTFVGNCAAGRMLPDEDAQLIVQRIFPGDFPGATYDAATCRTTETAADAGALDADGGGGP